LSNFQTREGESYRFVNISHTDFDINLLGLEVQCPYEYFHFPLLEALSIWRRWCFKTELLVFNDCEQVICFGLQDFLSLSIVLKASDLNVNVYIVPDNVEFYLRPEIYVNIVNKFSFKMIIKSLLNGVVVNYLKKEIIYFGGRPIYSMKKVQFSINNQFAFYEKKIQPPTDFIEHDNFQCRNGFISQPYYIDYNIDVAEWVDCLFEALSQSNCDIGDCIMFLHPRDNDEYIEELRKKNIKFTHSKNLPKNIFGIFSTYLFQLSINGYEVRSLARYFFKLLPSYYSEYLIEASKKFNVSCSEQDIWNVRKDDFYKLNASIEFKGL
jgi:hypothetical protein